MENQPNPPIILCVDDEPLVLDTLRQQLRDPFGKEFLLEIADSGQDALEVVEDVLAEGSELLVVISDYIMPGMKGDQVLSRVHQLSPKTLNILLTGQANMVGLTNAVNQANLYRFIAKPWSEADLVLTIREAIRRYRQDEQLSQQNERLQLLYEQAQQEISQRKQAEAALREHRDQLEEIVSQRTAQLEQYLEEVSTLNLIAQTAATSTDLQTILKTTAATLNAMLKGDETLVSLFDLTKMQVEVAVHHLSRDVTAARTFVGQVIPLVDTTATNRQVIISKAAIDTAKHAIMLTERVQAYLQEWGHHALLSVPLQTHGSIIGLITVTTQRPDRQATTDEIRLAETVASNIAGAVENVRLFEEERRQRQIAESLREVSVALSSSLDKAVILTKILQQLRHVIAFDSAGIFLQDDDKTLVLSEGVGFQETYLGYRINLTSPCPEAQVFNHRDVYVIDDVRLHPYWEAWTDNDPVRSWVGVPLLMGQTAIGVLTIDRFEVGAYGEETAHILQIFATQATITIQNAQLFLEAQRAQEAAEISRRAAEMANKAKSIFLANMTHELRTPLNAILGFAQVMTRSQTLPLEHHNNLSIISRSGEHLLTLINNVLDLSKIEAGRTTLNETNFDLYQLLDDLEDMFGFKATEKGLWLTFDRDSNLPRYIRTDEIKLRQILVNLLSNALKFTETGGVTLRAMRSDTPVQQDARAGVSDLSRLYFEVEDTGVGIASDELDKLFLAFSQTTSGRHVQEGTGLGLAIGRKFAKLMGGDITVSSKPNIGTKFTFDIKIHLIDEHDVEFRQPTQRVIGLQPDQPHYRILVADDKWTGRQLLLRLLEPLGFDVREAENGQEAIDVWQTWRPHLIWMDMRMPVMDGYEATKRIRASLQGRRTTIIVAITASVMEEEKAVVMSAGCDDFIRKPFREQEIFETMTKHLGVNFVYENLMPADAEATADTSPTLTLDSVPTALAELPLTLLTQLEEAVQRTNVTVVRQLITQVGQHNQPVADLLAKLNDDFEYEELQIIIQQARNNAHIRRNSTT